MNGDTNQSSGWNCATLMFVRYIFGFHPLLMLFAMEAVLFAFMFLFSLL